LQYKWGYLKINSSLLSPSGIDIDEENSILYIADKTRVTRLNLKLEFLSSWEFPKQREFGWIFRGLKLDSNTVSLTIHGLHQIFLCNCQDGKILKEFGTVFSGTKDGEFHYPYGLTVDNKYVYICDNENHRVQILTKEGSFFTKWGNGIQSTDKGHFSYPKSIYHHTPEDTIYVGDHYCVQLFRKDGACIQRLGDTKYGNQKDQFERVFGICVGWDDRLYVSDYVNKRIQIFKRATT